MRCFLGIPLPVDCRAAIRKSWSIPDHERPYLKLSDQGQWHVTLAFFGEIKYENVLKLVQMINRALESPPEGAFSVTRIQTFPPKKPSYFVALCQPEQEVAWRQCVSQIVDMTSLIAPQVDRKPWIPHVTLARGRHGHNLEPFEMSVNNIGWVPEFATLYQSELTPAGPKYTPLHEFRLNT